MRRVREKGGGVAARVPGERRIKAQLSAWRLGSQDFMITTYHPPPAGSPQSEGLEPGGFGGGGTADALLQSPGSRETPGQARETASRPLLLDIGEERRRGNKGYGAKLS